MQKLIILRGAPASGKTTVAKSFRNFENKVAWIKVDNFKDFFSEDASSALEFVNGSAISTLQYLLGQGFSVIIDGVFQDTSAIDKALEIAKEKNVQVKVFELTCSLEALQQRDGQREDVSEGLRKPLGEETIAEIYGALNNNPYPNAISIDTQHNSMEKCKELIEKSFQETKTTHTI